MATDANGQLNSDALVNIVIRTLNEEDWLKFCLLSVLRQNHVNTTITIVDSGSTDGTLRIASFFQSRYPKTIFIRKIEHFTPGEAINIGVAAVKSKYSVCLSAHCLPVDENWLTRFVSHMETNLGVGAAYGRQLPLSCTHPDDARDLLVTFGVESRVQKTDNFFHNANSIFRTSIWDSIRFDPHVKHVGDQIWAKELQAKGIEISYLADASVYHYHGLPNMDAPPRFGLVE